jgi:hypothetical protein
MAIIMHLIFQDSSLQRHHKSRGKVVVCHIITITRDNYCKLLRPEFVEKYAVPLSSDAFSKWGSYDPQYRLYEQNVREATQHLHTVVIPETAKELDSKWSSVATTLPEFLHAKGVNLRHLGKVRKSTVNTECNTTLLREMIVR